MTHLVAPGIPTDCKQDWARAFGEQRAAPRDAERDQFIDMSELSSSLTADAVTRPDVDGRRGTRGFGVAGANPRHRALLYGELAYRAADGLAVMFAVHCSIGIFSQLSDFVLGLLAVATSQIAFSATRIYDRPNRVGLLRLVTTWAQTFGFWTLAFVLMALADSRGLPISPTRAKELLQEPESLGQLFGVGCASLIAGRIALVAILRALGKDLLPRQQTVILGAGENAMKLAEYLRSQPKSELDLVGFIDPYDGGSAPTDSPVPTLGGIDRMVSLISQGVVDLVLIALPWSQAEQIEALARRLAVSSARVALVPDVNALAFPHQGISSLTGLPIVQFWAERWSGWVCVLKRIEDLVIASALVLCLAPIMAVIALAIKVDSPGPVFYCQPRYGLDNRIFRILKFRTMFGHLCDDGERQTIRGDARVTRIGAVLRRFSLDELPQLFNVLAGEMSIVGPRPHALSTTAGGHLFADAVASYMARHRVKPGITGWAQVNGWRGETDTLDKLAKRIEHDLYYIGNWSLKLDLLILLRSFSAVAKCANAY